MIRLRAAAGARGGRARARAAPPSAEALRPHELNTTFYPREEDTQADQKVWYLIDAEGLTLGRMATLAADFIRGKHLPWFSPSMDMGGYVVVVNAEKVQVTGKKADQKMYYRHSGRPGGQKSETFQQLQARIPERIVEKAVWGMIPKKRLGRRQIHHLKVYTGSEHPHEAQQPVDITHLVGKKFSECDMSKILEANGLPQ